MYDGSCTVLLHTVYCTSMRMLVMSIGGRGFVLVREVRDAS